MNYNSKIKLKHITNTRNREIDRILSAIISEINVDGLPAQSQAFVEQVRLVLDGEKLEYKNSFINCEAVNKLVLGLIERQPEIEYEPETGANITENLDEFDLLESVKFLDEKIKLNISLLDNFSVEALDFSNKDRLKFLADFYELAKEEAENIEPSIQLAKKIILAAPSYDNLYDDFLSRDVFENLELGEKEELQLLFLSLKNGLVSFEGVKRVLYCEKINWINLFLKPKFSKKIAEKIQKSGITTQTKVAKVWRKFYKDLLNNSEFENKKIQVPQNIKKYKKSHERKSAARDLERKTNKKHSNKWKDEFGI